MNVVLVAPEKDVCLVLVAPEKKVAPEKDVRLVLMAPEGCAPSVGGTREGCAPSVGGASGGACADVKAGGAGAVSDGSCSVVQCAGGCIVCTATLCPVDAWVIDISRICP